MDNNRRLARKQKLERSSFERRGYLKHNFERDADHQHGQNSRLMRILGTNAIRKSNVLLDISIANLQTSFPLHGDDETFKQDSQQLHNSLIHTESFLSEQLDNTATWNDYYRLATAHDFAVESAAAMAAFSSPAEHELRESIVDGAAGLAIDRMADALARYDTVTDKTEFTQLRGAIAEMLAMTLINYSQIPNRLAVPSTINDDARHRTDLYIYSMTDSGGRRVPVQVKSGFATLSPKGGFTLNRDVLGAYSGGQGFDKQPSASSSEANHFLLARTLIKEADGEELSSSDALALKVLINEFEAKLSEQLRKTPGNPI
ncbi:MAG: hypothetical protein EOO88_52165 [Pedobacter sp.]|nr:MAG: hypothetical protein EOO88_52165 [Pedobacter sp.]